MRAGAAEHFQFGDHVGDDVIGGLGLDIQDDRSYYA